MIDRLADFDPLAPAVIIDVGNTTVEMGAWHEGDVKNRVSIKTGDQQAFAKALTVYLDAMPRKQTPAVVVASVVPQALDQIINHVETTLDRLVLVIGDNVALPIDVDVIDPKAVGVDRVCAAAAAFDTIQVACTIVDFGTAVTVDLVNDEGTLLGGAILPGVSLQLQSLHKHTAALPMVTPAKPKQPYGRDTVEAIRVGVCSGLSGTVRGLVERYAGALNHWPQVVATGGDLELMIPLCDFLDTCVEDLTLRGIGLAYCKHMETADA